MAIRFFFSGIVVRLALTRSPFPIGRVYGVDLLGAAAGCLGALLLLNMTDGPSAVLWIAFIGGVGGWFFAKSAVGGTPDPKPPLHVFMRYRTAILVILLVSAFANGLTYYGLQPLIVKENLEGGGSHIFREWNTFSRIAVYPTNTGSPGMWGPSPKFDGTRISVEQRLLNIDGDASAIAYRFSGNLDDVAFLKYDVTNLAYHLPGRKRVAVIGVGGGRDLLSAAVFGFRDITGIEINPIFVKLITSKPHFTDFTNLTRLQGMRFIVDEGRNWFARTEEHFDIIQMSLVDTWAATGAGAFSLSENALYTLEAWKLFLARLTPSGVYTVSRWYDSANPTETARLLSLAVAALAEIGVREPDRHVFLASSGHIATLIVARQPLSAVDLNALNDGVARYDYRFLVSPTADTESEVLRTIAATRRKADLEEYASRQLIDISPPTDNRPFFFNQISSPFKAFNLFRVGVRSSGVLRGNHLATVTLYVLFLISLGFVVLTIVLPLRGALRDVSRGLIAVGTCYFMLIGAGFMMLEIGLIQRMSVFLGHPIYSLSIVLFAIILTTGAGSLLSDNLKLDTQSRFAFWALSTGGYIVVLSHWLSAVLLAFDSSGLIARAAICIGSIAPAGVLMGFGFPTGMRLVSGVSGKPTPWFWGINGAVGVLASVAAVATSIALGISGTLVVAACCYFVLTLPAFALVSLYEKQAARLP